MSPSGITDSKLAKVALVAAFRFKYPCINCLQLKNEWMGWYGGVLECIRMKYKPYLKPRPRA